VRFGIMLGSMVLATLALFGVFVNYSLEMIEEQIENEGAVLARALAAQSAFDFIMQDGDGMLEKLDVFLETGALTAGAFFREDGSILTEREGRDRFDGLLGYTESVRWTDGNHGTPELHAVAAVVNQGTGVHLGSVAIALPANALIDQREAAIRTAIAMSLLITAIALVILFLVRRTIIRPIHALRNAAGRVAAGDLNVHVENRRRDEVGELAASFNEMVAASRESRETMEAASADAEQARLRAEDLQRRADGERDRLRQQFGQISEFVAAVTHGDLTRRLHVTGDNDVSRLMEQLNAMVHDLAAIIAQVHQAGTRLSEAATRVASSAEQMSAGATDQAHRTADIATAIEQIATSICSSSRSAHDAAQTAATADDAARAGEEAFQRTAAGMERIARIVREAADRVAELGQSSAQIGEIVRVIGDIADQTNLLALNAAIEAARAGDQGRGFAVVADEVRKLAERTTSATKEIADMIGRIQTSTEVVVSSMQRGDHEVEAGLKLAATAGGSLSEITSSIRDLVAIIDQIAAAAEEQSATSTQITHSVESIASVSNEVSHATSDMARTADVLSRQAVEMGGLTRRFDLADEEATPGTQAQRLAN
jgi:methyl-accepting chemotaxis protein